VRGSIAFENVTFGYDRHQPVLNNVSFEVQPGEMIGIVGRSGSGKTTLVNLLGRFYDVQEGRILLDGIDVRELSMQQLRKNVGIVFQDSFLFRGTIWENLSYGRPETTIAEGIAASKAAGAHDFICRTQLGYESPLGEQGAGLSGGEKQRLSIARTLLYDPKILILDEATSNIDAEAERAIQQALEVLIHGRTAVVIAHRLSTLRNSDRILVFDRGRLIEQGSHAELLASDGTYARLVRIQTQISKEPSVDKLALQQADSPSSTDNTNGATLSINKSKKETSHTSEKTSRDKEPVSGQTVPSEPAAHSIVWLKPQTSTLSEGSRRELLVSVTPPAALVVSNKQAVTGGGIEFEPHSLVHSCFVVSTFPATHPEQYLSVRTWNSGGEEREVGIIEDLREWPSEIQKLVRDSLAKRYMFRKIEKIHKIESAHGYLEFDVETPQGREQFTMRWSQSQAQEFGTNGKLISDTEDNRYVIPNLDQLSPADRTRFQQHVYW
jgi:ATP-binding cassette, subfamily B, bacterial